MVLSNESVSLWTTSVRATFATYSLDNCAQSFTAGLAASLVQSKPAIKKSLGKAKNFAFAEISLAHEQMRQKKKKIIAKSQSAYFAEPCLASLLLLSIRFAKSGPLPRRRRAHRKTNELHRRHSTHPAGSPSSHD